MNKKLLHLRKANPLIHLPGWIVLAFLLSIMGMQSGCAQQTTEVTQNPFVAQVIIRFAPDVTNPAEPGFLKRLKQGCNVDLIYVRPMAVSAHILKITASNEVELETAIKCLSQRPDIVYAERDRILRPQEKE